MGFLQVLSLSGRKFSLRQGSLMPNWSLIQTKPDSIIELEYWSENAHVHNFGLR